MSLFRRILIINLLIIVFLSSCSSVNVKVKKEDLLEKEEVTEEIKTIEPTKTKEESKVLKPEIDGFKSYIYADQKSKIKIQYPKEWDRYDKEILNIEDNKKNFLELMGERSFDDLMDNIDNLNSIWYNFSKDEKDYINNANYMTNQIPGLDGKFIDSKEIFEYIKDGFQKQVSEYYSDFGVNIKKNGEIVNYGGNEFIVFEFTQKSGLNDLTYLQAMIVKDTIFHSFTFAEKTSDFDQDIINIEKFLSSIEFLN